MKKSIEAYQKRKKPIQSTVRLKKDAGIPDGKTDCGAYPWHRTKRKTESKKSGFCPINHNLLLPDPISLVVAAFFRLQI